MIDTRPEFARVRQALSVLLAELTAADWQQPTACAPWLVRDVVAHILGDDLARLSRSRDGYPSPGPAAGETLPVFLHRHNQQWVDAAGRISTVLLRDLLEAVTPQVLAFWRDADLDALGEAVSWASPGPAPVWLDCARDFTEYWTHLQQILAATGRPALADDEALHSALDTFARALRLTLERHAPHAGGCAHHPRAGSGGRRLDMRTRRRSLAVGGQAAGRGDHRHHRRRPALAPVYSRHRAERGAARTLRSTETRG